jgi:GDP-L-fucose synthase
MLNRILVTGSSAVAGSAIKKIHKEIDAEFIFMTSKDCDLRNYEATMDYISSKKPDGIIHLAAVSGGIGLSIKHQASMLRDNILLNSNIMEASRLFDVKKIVMTLTTGMYSPNSPLPLKEEFIHEGAPHLSNYGSSFAKRLVEPAIRAYKEEYNLNVVGLIPNGIFGENDNFNYEDAPMLPALIRRFYENKNNNEDIVIWGDGSPLREYTYSEDVARAFLWALFQYNDVQILNSGTTEELAIKDIATLIAEYTGVDPKRIKFDSEKPNGVFKKSTDNSRFVNLSGFQYTPFKVGLKKTIDWFAETYVKSPDLIRMYSKSKG